MERKYKIASLIVIVLIAVVLLTSQTATHMKPQTTYTLQINTFLENRIQNKPESVDETLGTVTLSYIPSDTSESNTVPINSYKFSLNITDTIKVPTGTQWLLITCDLKNGFEPDLRHTFDWNSIIYDYVNSTFYVDLNRVSQPEIILELYFYGP
jgi:hypothetical protein